jgi:hypothetical protein
MNSTVPMRSTLVWLILILATCITWWLGTGHTGERGATWEVSSLVVIACVKIHLVGYEFMELRSAPSILRFAFSAWTTALGLVAAVLVLS